MRLYFLFQDLDATHSATAPTNRNQFKSLLRDWEQGPATRPVCDDMGVTFDVDRTLRRVGGRSIIMLITYSKWLTWNISCNTTFVIFTFLNIRVVTLHRLFTGYSSTGES